MGNEGTRRSGPLSLSPLHPSSPTFMSQGFDSHGSSVSRRSCKDTGACGADAPNVGIGERHPSEARTTSVADLKVHRRLREEFGLVNCWQAANPGVPLAQTLRWSNAP